jgi:hypothetical protein
MLIDKDVRQASTKFQKGKDRLSHKRNGEKESHHSCELKSVVFTKVIGVSILDQQASTTRRRLETVQKATLMSPKSFAKMLDAIKLRKAHVAANPVSNNHQLIGSRVRSMFMANR